MTRYTETRAMKRAACFAHASQDPAGVWEAHDAMRRSRGRERGCAAAEACALHARSRRAGEIG